MNAKFRVMEYDAPAEVDELIQMQEVEMKAEEALMLKHESS